MPDTRIDKLADRTILYDRQVEGHYGVTGVPIRPYMNKTFAEETDACFREVIERLERHGLGPVGSILTGGIGRAGNGASYHHKNRAFDLDGLIMPADQPNWVADTFPTRPLIYLGIEAALRRNFGTVISYDYDDKHKDHFHFDNGQQVRFSTRARTHVIFVQNVIVFVYHVRIGRDGIWGPETRGALDRLRRELGFGGLSDRKNWLAFLDRVSDDALALEAETSALVAENAAGGA